MKVTVNLGEGQQLTAKFGQHSITSDQSKTVGGNEEYPEPFEYFLASMPLCAGFYVRQFCIKRDISTKGLIIEQENITIDEQDHYKKKIILSITLPPDFPDKYKKAVLAAANTCTVKKVIQAMPEFEIELV